jgi:streptogramin lyase
MRRLVRYLIWQAPMLFIFAVTSSAQTPILAVADFFSRYIFRFNATTGALIDILPTDIATQAQVHDPQILTFGPDGNLYVPTVALPNSPPPLFGGGILRFNGVTGASLGVFAFDAGNGPRGITFGPDGNVYATTGNNIQRFDGKSGAFIDNFVPCCPPELFDSQGLRFGPDGNLYVVSTPIPTYPMGNVVKYDGKTGALLGTFSSGTSPSLPHDLVFGPDGNLYVGSVIDGRILRYNGQTGSFMGAFVSTGSDGLDSPWGLAFGPDGNLYVSSYHNGFRNGNSGGVLRFNGPKKQNPGAPIDLFIPTNGDIVFETPSGLAFSNAVGCHVDPQDVRFFTSTFGFRPVMAATFLPPNGLTLAEYASACGFKGFDWQQKITIAPCPSAVYAINPAAAPMCPDGSVGSVSPTLAFNDPPRGGYKNRPGDPFPFYYPSGQAIAEEQSPTGGACIFHAGLNCIPLVSADGKALGFFDAPADPCLSGILYRFYCTSPAPPGSFVAFTTSLVGINQDGVTASATLFHWSWTDTFNGLSGGIATTFNGQPPDPGSGTGDITIIDVNGMPQVPPNVACAATPDTLWPPNGKSVVITVSGAVTAGTQAIPTDGTTYAVTDEYGLIQPSGSFAFGAGGSYSFAVPLIAARDGNDPDGRTYTIVVAARDQIGNTGSCSTVVTVTHDQGN